MPQQISPKITALTFGILVICFAVAFYVIAWTEPTVAPPGGNVSTPLNISATAQTKAGGLTVNGLLKTLQDMVIGVVTIKENGAVSPNLNSDKLDDYNAADLMAGTAGGGGVLTIWGHAQSGEWVSSGEGSEWVVNTPLPGTGAPVCPSGWTEAYKGYGPYWAYLQKSDYTPVGAHATEVCGTNITQLAGAVGSGYSFYWAEAAACSRNYGSAYYTIRCNTCRVCVK